MEGRRSLLLTVTVFEVMCYYLTLTGETAVLLMLITLFACYTPVVSAPGCRVLEAALEQGVGTPFLSLDAVF